jgi:Family of unknown function (DUF5762)
MEGIWYKDPYTFLRPENMTKFIPFRSMSFVEQLNSALRFSLYLSLLLFLVKQNSLVFYISLFVAFLTALLYEFYSRNNRMRMELYNKIDVRYDKQKNEFCALPTQNNPFMNVLMNEYTDFPNRPGACDINNRRVKKQAEKYFDNNLYRDVDDIWNRKTSSRNWHTVPSATIPNDRQSFQDWLYKTGPTCKEGNGNQCYINKFRDLSM